MDERDRNDQWQFEQQQEQEARQLPRPEGRSLEEQ